MLYKCYVNRVLRDCQYNAEVGLENALKTGEKKNLAVLATGSGKTYLACLASYRLLNYTSTKRVLFLVDRNNLARQTESEFSLFDRTETQQPMSHLYEIARLRHEEDIKADIVISTIQKLFAVLTGQQLTEENEDAEDEESKRDEEKNSEEPITLSNDLKLPSDYFQFIVVDECHRSIYGKWRAVLDYFSDAKILGLTATPTPEAYAFFNNNIIEKYTYDESVVDGVNVPSRVYRIKTEVTEVGGVIEKGSKVTEVAHKTGQTTEYSANHNYGYTSAALDRSVVNRDQIKTVLTAYKEAIYSDLYPDREKKWEYIPKTLIFAKDDSHASLIVDVAKEVFAPENKMLADYISDMKLTVQAPSGEEISVTRETLVGFTDNNEFLTARRELLSADLDAVNRKIQSIEKQKNKEDEIFKVQTAIEAFDSDIKKINVDPIATKRIIEQLKKEKQKLQEQIRSITKQDNNVIVELHNCISSLPLCTSVIEQSKEMIM